MKRANCLKRQDAKLKNLKFGGPNHGCQLPKLSPESRVEVLVFFILRRNRLLFQTQLREINREVDEKIKMDSFIQNYYPHCIGDFSRVRRLYRVRERG